MRRIIEGSTAHGSALAKPLVLLACLAILASASAPAARAQAAAVETGDHVRVSVASQSEPIVGRVESVAKGSFHLVRDSDERLFIVAPNEVRRLERRTGLTGAQRAAFGGAAGAGLGLLFGVVTTEEVHCKSGSRMCFDIPDKAAAGLGYGMIGSLVGALVGSVVLPRTSWEDVSLPRLTVDATPGGASVAVRIPLLAGGRR